MSGGFSLFPEMANGFSSGLSATTGGTTVQANTSSTNTKGSWVQLTASTANDATWAMVKIIGDNSINSNCNNFLVDIGLGAAASEVVIAPNFHFNSFNGFMYEPYIFPVTIPAGTRIAARAQADATSLNSVYVSIQLFDSGYTSPIECGGLNDIGTNTANSQLTAVTTGTSGAKGSYAQLTASSSADYAGLLIVPSSHGVFNTVLVDIAVGAGGSEQIIIPDTFMWSTTGNSIQVGYNSFPYFTQIPAGTRISARASASGGSSPTAFQLAVYGVLQ